MLTILNVETILVTDCNLKIAINFVVPGMNTKWHVSTTGMSRIRQQKAMR